MNNKVLFFIVIVFALFVSACGSSPKVEQTKTPVPTPTQSGTSTTCYVKAIVKGFEDSPVYIEVSGINSNVFCTSLLTNVNEQDMTAEVVNSMPDGTTCTASFNGYSIRAYSDKAKFGQAICDGMNK